MADILISETIPGAAIDALASRFSVLTLPELWKDPALLAQKIAGCRAIIIRNQTQLTAGIIDAASDLLVIGRAGVGFDNIDMEHARQAGIVVAYTPDQNAVSVAELAIGLMISLARSIPDASEDTRRGNWNRHRFLGMELYGKTLGIIGAGKIGYLTARRAMALGMSILASDPFISRDNIHLTELHAELLDLDELLARSDVVSCHLPASRETVGLLDARRFARMKRGALFINTSRGQVVSEPDLLEALKAGILAGAALDVRSTEPPLAGELEHLPNVILLPHLGAITREAQERVTRAVCQDVTRVLEGKPALNPAAIAIPQRGKRV